MDRRERKNAWGRCRMICRVARGLLGLVVLVVVGSANANAETLLAQMQMSPMRQDSINKMPPAPETSRTAVVNATALPSETSAQAPAQAPFLNGTAGANYDPAGRRDPFLPILQELQLGKVDESLPPLQRVALSEINLIAIVWGGTYGYLAMVQTPEGHGYTVKRGTKIGHNNGVVSAVTERGIIVEERFTDLYGTKQEREYVKLLHPKEGSE